MSLRLDDWIALAGDGFDEGGFSAAIGAENCNMLTCGYAEVDVVEDCVVAAGYVDVLQMEEGCHVLLTRIDGGVWERVSSCKPGTEQL